MTSKIHKFMLAVGESSIMIQPDARLLRVGICPSSGEPALWCEVDASLEASEQHDFVVYGTGEEIVEPEGERHYVGTAIGDTFVWHVFEVPTAEAKAEHQTQMSLALEAAMKEAAQSVVEGGQDA